MRKEYLKLKEQEHRYLITLINLGQLKAHLFKSVVDMFGFYRSKIKSETGKLLDYTGIESNCQNEQKPVVDLAKMDGLKSGMK